MIRSSHGDASAVTSAMLDLYARTLKWPVPNMRYELLSNA